MTISDQHSSRDGRDAAQSTAAWALLGLGLSFASCVAGGATAVSAWPNKRLSHSDER